MSSKHIIGIGQLEPGRVAIIHGNALQCDHAVPMLQECPLCLARIELERISASKTASASTDAIEVG